MVKAKITQWMNPLTAFSNNAHQLIIREEAHSDTKEAYSYYEENLPDLVNDFCRN